MEKRPLDRKIILQKLQKEYNCGPAEAELRMHTFDNLAPEAVPLFEAWYNGEVIDYTLQDISISYIMEKLNCSFLDAVTWMNQLIKEPGRIEAFKSMNFRRR